MKIFVLLLSLFSGELLLAQLNPPQVYLNDETLTYYELIAEYKKLDEASDKAKLLTYGLTDSGKPLHVFVISEDGNFTAKAAKENGKLVVLINNGIHPGEPAGMEASLQLAAQLLNAKSEINEVLKNTVVCIIPAYNIGGMLNRSPFNRANQNGPKACGFRGNARNIDLNRDYIICKTENAKSFTQIFQQWQPDVFLETHTTDGSDHQQTITLITTAHQDLPPSLGTYLHDIMEPELYKMMKEKSKYLMCPYVHVWRKPPDKGYQQFLEQPRYSTGYTSLFNTISFMTENHIFKPYKDRVLSCLDFMHCLLNYTSQNAKTILDLREKANEELEKQNTFNLDWKLDSSKFDWITFHGYAATYPPSKLSGEPLLYYDRNQPYTKKIKYFNHFDPVLTKAAPKFYVLPQAWSQAVNLLKLNNVKMERLPNDTALLLDMYYIDDYKTFTNTFNGNYPHYDIKTSTKSMRVTFYKGDYLIPVTGNNKAYIMHALEPEAPDSYFTWNLFDEILQSREYFSPFIFEKKALALLDTLPGLREKLHVELEKDSTLQKSAYRQMLFIYQHSPYFEVTYKRYPVGKIY